RITNESTATALSYRLNNKEGLIVVFDLGGGTYDVSRLEISNSISELEIPEMLYICVNLALEAGQKLKTCTTEEGLLQQLNYAKEHIGSLADFYKDTGHLPYDWE
ncbi:heat shock 70 kDa protein, mitochondrial, partial [Tanacetum coccineum]